MGKQVPLVIYKGGTRTVIGMASVQEDGGIEAQVAKDHWPMVKDLFLPNIGELSIAPVYKKPKPNLTYHEVSINQSKHLIDPNTPKI